LFGEDYAYCTLKYSFADLKRREGVLNVAATRLKF